jgi:hypothetical protein
MQTKHTAENTEASAVKDARTIKELVSALKAIERISKPERNLGYCNVDPIDLLLSVRAVALKALAK